MANKTDAQLTTDNTTVATKYDNRYDYVQLLKTFLKDLIDSKLSNITSLINQGSNVTISGSGTSASPYVINSTASGASGITALTGDGTASGTGSVALTLATVNSNVGTFNNGITVNAKGLTTAVTAIPNATTSTTGLLLFGDWNTFNNKVSNATHTGDVTGATALTITNSAVTYAKIQNITTARLLGRATAGSGIVEEITLGSNLSFTGTTLNATGGSTITDITYANIVIAIGASTLTKGAFYRITDFATVHDILTSSPNVVNTGTTEPLIIFATGINTLSEQAFSELYPQDIIRYEVANTKMAGATKGVILFRHDTDKNISCFYDWRNVKNRDYDGLWQSTNVVINSSKTITAGTATDIFTFFNSSTPTNVTNVNIGLRSENNRINNITFSSVAGGSYVREIRNLTIEDGCYDIRIGSSSVQQIQVINATISKNCYNLRLLDLATARFTGKIGNFCYLIYISKPLVGTFGQYLGTNFQIGSGNNNISISDSFESSEIENNCNYISILNKFDENKIKSNSESLSFNNTFQTLNCEFLLKNKIFSSSITGIYECIFISNNTSSKTYTTAPATYNLIFDKVDSSGDLWATSITTVGVISQVKMV